MTPGRTVVVIAKAPVAGRVKTRLCPPLTPDEAAALAAAALDDTLDTIGSVPAARRVLALDGATGPWVPTGFEVVPQARGRLDQRIAAALVAGSGPTVLVGMDSPQLVAADITGAFALMEDGIDAVLGPATDGGYWLLGLATPEPRAVVGVPMSVAHTGQAQRARLDALGLTNAIVRTLRDVDRYEDALAVAGEIPDSRFARAVDHVAHTTIGPAR
jgi:hypothetical protein